MLCTSLTSMARGAREIGAAPEEIGLCPPEEDTADSILFVDLPELPVARCDDLGGPVGT